MDRGNIPPELVLLGIVVLAIAIVGWVIWQQVGVV